MGLVIQRKIQRTLQDCVSICTCVLDIFTILLLLLFSAWIRVSPLSLLWQVALRSAGTFWSPEEKRRRRRR